MPRLNIIFKCTECNYMYYLTKKNPKNTVEKLELNKYCKKCCKSVLHKEAKPK